MTEQVLPQAYSGGFLCGFARRTCRRRRWVKIVNSLAVATATIAWLLGAVAAANAATIRTGDSIASTPVIQRLDAADLEPGTLDRFWFRALDNSVGQAWLVPVIVLRGKRPGPRLLLTAAIHGDELNGIDVIHRLAATLDPAKINGTVVMIPGVNAPGLLHHTRAFTPGDGRDGANLNRLMPGKTGPKAESADLYANSLWSNLLRPNADVVIDMHTQSRGTAYVMYAFASSQRTRRIAELIGPDILKLDPGEKGTIETEMNRVGVPAITLELARPEEFQPEIVARAADGILRVMSDLGLLPADAAPPLSSKTFVGNELTEVVAQRGGFAHILASLGSDVKKGDLIATISDPFGRVVERVIAPESGRVNTVATEPRRDPGDMLLRIIYNSADPKCRNGC